ncbi:MAG: glycosyltransferase family 2 protein [Pseudomonadota bacterium]
MHNLETWFDPQWYLQQYPDVARAGLDPLKHYLNNGIEEGRLPSLLQALAWETTLWEQTAPSDECLQALNELHISTNPVEASYAAFALGRWHAGQGQWLKAASALAVRSQISPRLPAHNGAELLEVEALTRSGQLAMAWEKLGQLRHTAPEFLDSFLATANLLSACAEQFDDAPETVKQAWQVQRLGWINLMWQQAGLDVIQPAQPERSLSLDNLAPAGPLSGAEVFVQDAGTPLVSVIVPAYNAELGLETALRSLAEQTLANAFPGAVEVIVVDDASTDHTADIAEAFAASTPGFRVLRQPENAGAYAARNRALAEARGQCLTVHDADDWSHPRKLEIQWRGLQDNPQWMACNSHWVRCDSQMVFSRWRMEESWIYRNTSSLMFRRVVFERLGYWDQVRVEADTEFYYRIRTAFGPGSTGEVLPGIPLAFGRVVPTALTVMSATHLATQYAGVRADYRKAAFEWHATADGELYLPRQPEQRPFPAPVAILP